MSSIMAAAHNISADKSGARDPKITTCCSRAGSYDTFFPNITWSWNREGFHNRNLAPELVETAVSPRSSLRGGNPTRLGARYVPFTRPGGYLIPIRGLFVWYSKGSRVPLLSPLSYSCSQSSVFHPSSYPDTGHLCRISLSSTIQRGVSES